MQQVTLRRKRRRRPTFTPRFGPASVAFEIGLLRMSLDLHREEIEKKKDEEREK